MVAAQHLFLLLRRAVVDEYFELESVELRLWKGISPFVLDRVLGSQDDERPGQGIAGAVDCHLPLFHGFEQRCLGLRRRAVDLIGENDRCEDRPGLDAKRARRQVEHACPDNVGRHQVRGELNPLEVSLDESREDLRHQGLAGARHAFEENVAAGDQGDHYLLKLIVQANERSVRLGAETQPRFTQYHDLALSIEEDAKNRLDRAHTRQETSFAEARSVECREVVGQLADGDWPALGQKSRELGRRKVRADAVCSGDSPSQVRHVLGLGPVDRPVSPGRLALEEAGEGADVVPG